MSYRAKRDWWAKFLLAPLLLALIGGGIWVLYTGVHLVQVPTMTVLQWQRPTHEMAVGLIMIVIGTALFWSFAASRYQIGEPELIIGSGIDQRRVAISSIVEVVPTSAAVVIAPADKEEFLQALAEAAPQLRWSDDRALRLATQVTNN
jgi:hypothetical protein